MALRGIFYFFYNKKFGLTENGEKIRNEFTTYRSLKAQKIFIAGPPAGGKTYLTER